MHLHDWGLPTLQDSHLGIIPLATRSWPKSGAEHRRSNFEKRGDKGKDKADKRDTATSEPVQKDVEGCATGVVSDKWGGKKEDEKSVLWALEYPVQTWWRSQVVRLVIISVKSISIEWNNFIRSSPFP